MFEKHLWKSDILSKNQLPGLSISGTLLENELMQYLVFILVYNIK